MVIKKNPSKRVIQRKPTTLIVPDRVEYGVYKEGTKARIVHLRRLILFHSYMYYRRHTNLVEDHVYDAWALELGQLNKDYPRLKEYGDYAGIFQEWDGSTSTGFDLPLGEIEIIEHCERIYRNIERYKQNAGSIQDHHERTDGVPVSSINRRTTTKVVRKSGLPSDQAPSGSKRIKKKRIHRST